MLFHRPKIKSKIEPQAEIQSGLAANSSVGFLPRLIAGSHRLVSPLKSWRTSIKKTPRTSQDPVISRVLEEEIAYGGTAHISRITYSNGEVQIEKTLSPRYQSNSDYEQLQIREHRILSLIDHPLVVKPFAIVRRPSLTREITNVLILEHVKGANLSALSDFIDALSLEDRSNWGTEILKQLLSVLQHLRSQFLIHGDLAPENLLIQSNGLIKVVDFGVSREHSDSVELFEIAGRNNWRAPELRRTGGTSLSGDVYAVGKIFEWIIGHKLADQESYKETIRDLCEHRKLPETFCPIKDDSQMPATYEPHQIRVLPDVESLLPKATPRTKTFVIPKPSIMDLFRFETLKSRAVVLLILFPFITSWQPQVATMTVNTLPYSMVIFDSHSRSIQYHTPVRDFKIASGRQRLYFVVPSQANRRIIREVHLMPGQHLKLFEDFRNLDTFKR